MSKTFKRHLKVRFDITRWKENIPVSYDSFKVCLHEFKHEMQIPFMWEAINQLNYIWIIELFKQFDFSKSCKIHPFFLLANPNLLNCNRLSCLSMK